MPKTNDEKLKRQIELLEHKRIKLPEIFTQSTEEDFYLWSLVDLMTLLLIFFILFYSRAVSEKVTQLDHFAQNQAVLQTEKPVPYQEGQVESVSSSDSSRFIGTDHGVNIPKFPKADPSLEQLRLDILSAIDHIEYHNFSVQIDRQQLILTLGECITFFVGQADLIEDFQPTLKRIARFIASKEGYRVSVSGHTDDTPINTPDFPSNWELSAARSVNVAKFLIKNGVDSQRVSIQGYAEYRPLFDNNSPENKQANRRVEITLIKEQDEAVKEA
ncbi:MAG: flagellar motor protein MotB [Desulfobacterales bacterium]|nr:flagellar motor protein MotB [Desulfobacterales bacterium]